MNTFNKSVIEEFRSAKNTEQIQRYLNNTFGDATVKKFLEINFPTMISSACVRFERELSVSDPVPGVSVYEQSSAFTNQFVNDMIGYINAYVVGKQNINPAFTLCDGDPTSRSSLKEHQRRNPNQVLASWNVNAASALTGRDDSQYGNAPANEYAYSDQDALRTGITFSDQRTLGQNQYYDYLFNPAFHALNRGQIAGGIVGDWSPQADERLLSRRIFRNESGTGRGGTGATVENGIPFYNITVTRRNLDRDITQNLRQGEYDYKLYRHDVDDLYRRADMRKNFRMTGGESRYC